MRCVAFALAPLVLAACGSGQSPTAAPAITPVDAAVPDVPPPDAGPSAALIAAPAWVFRYDAPPRVETWTLRQAAGEAQIVVETPGGAPVITTYLGTATPTADALVIEVATATAKLALRCTPATRPIGATCKERKPAAIAVLDCFVPGYEQPMTFAPAPGVVFDGGCGAYRRLP